jgi:ABC-type phosphate transport system permease subunit
VDSDFGVDPVASPLSSGGTFRVPPAVLVLVFVLVLVVFPVSVLAALWHSSRSKRMHPSPSVTH